MVIGLEQVRYLKTLNGLLKNWIGKTVLSSVTGLWLLIKDLTETEPLLAVAVFLVFFIDLITGIISSKRKKNPLTSIGLRQTGVKVIEYAVTIGVFTIAANAFGEFETTGWVKTILMVFKNVDYFAYAFIFWTEALSIYENLGGKGTHVDGLWEHMKDKIDDKINAKK